MMDAQRVSPMSKPPVQYLVTRDGKSIAYAACGEGEPLVLVPGLFGYVNLGWDLYPSWFESLTTNFRFIHYDERGSGLSHRPLSERHVMADWLRDLEAVMDGTGSEPAVLLAGCHGGHIAVRYALKHPERVKALVLNTCSLRQDEWTPSMWQVVARENWQFFLRNVSPPNLSPDDTERCMRGLEKSQSREDLEVAVQALFPSTIEDEVWKLDLPTLVLSPRESTMLLPESMARLASRIKGSRLVSIAGEYIYGDGVEGVAAIRDFLSQLPEAASEAFTADGLSSREIEVLRLLAAGRSNQQIADDLVISLNTVRRHVSNLFDKIGVANRAQAAVYAKDHGLA
jgi:pimeloyl-ACP methyl ester carboxylesterase/DNA-binding CsgD family transcriptional regulator